MKRQRIFNVAVVITAMVLILLAATYAGAAGPQKTKSRPGELIVRYRPYAAPLRADEIRRQQAEKEAMGFVPASAFAEADRPASLKALESKFGLAAVRPLSIPANDKISKKAKNGADPLRDFWLLRFDGKTDAVKMAKEFSADPSVLLAEPNYVGTLCYVPADPLYGETRNDYSLIGLEAAWDVQPGAAGVRVAVIDSGVDATHPELAPSLDLSASYNFVESNAHIFDDIGHGTRVAGIIGAIANNEGIAGVGFGCALLSLDVADAAGVISVANAATAVSWAAAHDADIIHLSMRFNAPGEALRLACEAAQDQGALLVAPAGNEGRGDRPVYPASFAAVVGVGAVTDDGATRAPWSNYNGLEKSLVELVAPGATVFSTIPGAQYNGSFGSGTSFAAPMVTGAAALLKARHPGQSGRALRRHLTQTARALAGFEPVGGAGAGLLDAAAALAAPMLPELAVASVAVDDDKALAAANNGDGILQRGESVRLRVALSNSGADANDVTGTLATTDPLVTLGDPAAAWGAVASGSAGAPQTNFISLALDAGAPAHPIPLTLNVNANGGYAAMLNFTLAAESFASLSIIAEDMTWTSDTTWLIPAKTVVTETAKLTIEPGTTVRFSDDAELEVRGMIESFGTEDHHITFSSLDGMPGEGFGEHIVLHQGKKLTPSLAAGDLNNDGKDEIAVMKYEDFREIYIFDSNNSNGSPSSVRVPPHVLDLVIGDTDHNGMNEILALAADRSVIIIDFFNNFYRVTNILQLSSTPNNMPQKIYLADLDGNGDDEILIQHRFTSGSRAWNGISRIEWADETYLGNQIIISFTDPDQILWESGIKVGDLDQIPGDEILFGRRGAGDSRLFVYKHGRPLKQVYSPTAGDPGEWPYFIGDINNDGKNDILMENRLFSWNGINYVSVPVEPSRDFGSQVGDIDNDGENETYEFRDGSLWIYEWDGDGRSRPLDLGSNNANILSVLTDHNGDGKLDTVFISDNEWRMLSVLLWNPQGADKPRYKGMWLRDTTRSANFAFCDFEFAPVLDEATTSTYADCLFDRAGGAFALRTNDPSTGSIARCTVRGNSAGNGIVAYTRDLFDCIAEDNDGIGLTGNLLIQCEARRNQKGMIANSDADQCIAEDNNTDGIYTRARALDCFATGNGGWGITSSSNNSAIAAGVYDSISIHNGSGIQTRYMDIVNCLARDNAGTGFLAADVVRDSIADSNGGNGISANIIQNSIAVNNADRVICQTLESSTLAQYGGEVGVMANEIRSSVIHHGSGDGADGGYYGGSIYHSWIHGNGGSGVLNARLVENCSIQFNQGDGVRGRLRGDETYTSISLTTIANNIGDGVVAINPIQGSNLYDNGGVDFRETRPSTELLQVDATNNYWGPVTTALMDAHPWGTYYNIPAIHDFVDNLNLAEVKYAGHLASPIPGARPDDSAPAFLYAVTPDTANPVGIGPATFTLTFSKTMDTSVTLSVTFNQEAPYTSHVVEPAPGWVDAVTWRGTYPIQTSTGDGKNTVRVGGATAADGFVIPDDTAHTFTIDTTGGLPANNGIAIGNGTRMTISWSDAGRPPDALGYNLHRSATGQPGTFQKVNSAAIPTNSYLDEGLEHEKTYFYIVYLVDSKYSAIQWTPPFYGHTNRNAASQWELYR